MADALPHADEALLVLLAAVLVQPVRVVEPPLAEAAHGVLLVEVRVELRLALAPSGAAGCGGGREELVLVREDLLVRAAQVAQRAVVH